MQLRRNLPADVTLISGSFSSDSIPTCRDVKWCLFTSHPALARTRVWTAGGSLTLNDVTLRHSHKQSSRRRLRHRRRLCRSRYARSGFAQEFVVAVRATDSNDDLSAHGSGRRPAERDRSSRNGPVTPDSRRDALCAVTDTHERRGGPLCL